MNFYIKMLSIVIALCISLATSSNGLSCEKCQEIPKHYQELNCKAITEEGKCCPTRYECPEIPNDGKCYYNTRAYDLDVKFPDEEHPQCLVGCRCKNLYPTNRTNIECVSIECPQDFNPDPECLYLRRVRQCCADVICEKSEIEQSNAVKCYYDGKVYKDGDEIRPNDETLCFCAKGFDNSTLTNNSNCEKQKKTFDCNIPLHYYAEVRDGCVPIYYKSASQCPIEWRCPNDSDEKVEQPELKLVEGNQSTCTFGRLNFALNEELKHPKSCVSCGCWAPPMIHCIQNGNC